MSNHRKTKCYICGFYDYSLMPGKVRDNAKLKLLECSSCGLVYLSDFKHINNSFYLNSCMHTFGSQIPTVEKWLKETEHDDERRFQFYKTTLRNKTLLDFGCGAGGFLLKAKNKSIFTFYLLELSSFSFYNCYSQKIIGLFLIQVPYMILMRNSFLLSVVAIP